MTGRRHWLAEARLARRIRRIELYVEGSNLFNEAYQEIAGVVAPPRWIRGGIAVR